MMRGLLRRLKSQEALPAEGEDSVSSGKRTSRVLSRASLRLSTSRKKKGESIRDDAQASPSSPTDGSPYAELAETYSRPPPRPTPKRQEQVVEIRGAMRDGPVQVSDTINLFTVTWNMAGVAVLPSQALLSTFIPSDYDLYAISLQNSRSVKQVQEKIHQYLGEDDFEAFKFLVLGQSSLLMFARKLLTASGVLFPTRLNDLVKFEVKNNSLLGGGSGRGCILMQVMFHNTTMAFVSMNLDDELDGLERRVSDLKYCLEASGVAGSVLNEIGTPVLTSVQHVFLLGNFGLKTTGKCTGSSKHTWRGKWSELLYEVEFDAMTKAAPSLDEFDELEVNFPPTCRRKAATISATLSKDGPNSPRGAIRKEISFDDNLTPSPERRLSDAFVSLFAKDFDVSELFDAKAIKKEGEPSYPDRIMFRTRENYKHLMEAGCSGTAELVRTGTHVPVYSTFRLCGVDASLLRRWQIITGNMPVENATRTDFRMVKGLVDNLMEGINEKAAQEAENERMRLALIASMPRCERCAEPLSLEGGDVDLGEKGAFHRNCFTCEDCGKDLFGDTVMCADDKWLCLESFNRMYKTACPVCTKPILGPRIRTGKSNVSYHMGCFKCHGACGQLLVANDGSFKDFRDFEGRPYCPTDFASFQNKCCFACKMELADEDRVRPDVQFHKQCYLCAICGLDMDKSEHKAVVRDYKVLCEPDHLKDIALKEKKMALRKERQEAKKEEEESKRKEKEMLARRISMIPKGFDPSNYDIPEDEDIAEEDDDD